MFDARFALFNARRKHLQQGNPTIGLINEGRRYFSIHLFIYFFFPELRIGGAATAKPICTRRTYSFKKGQLRLNFTVDAHLHHSGQYSILAAGEFKCKDTYID